MRRFPCHAEIDEAGVTALGTGAVSSSESSGFIEEEKLGVAARRHHRPLAAPKLEYADDPPLEHPVPPDVTVGVVQDAPIAHERAPLGSRNDLAERCDPVPFGQWASSRRTYLAALLRASIRCRYSARIFSGFSL